MMKRAVLLCLVALVQGTKKVGTDPVSHQHPPEAHHSLHPPLDRSQVYWNMGGSTVISKNLIRLTPNTQDRQGWLWNEYPLETENWEVEFKVKVWSTPHFGGDGFGFWILSGDQDPTFFSEPDWLNGPIMGMRDDFDGFGVIFDVYDNDNRRDNPGVCVLKNLEGGETDFAHDKDYAEDMVKSVPEHVPGHVGADDGTVYKAHRCRIDLRNTKKDVRVLVKYLHKVLHVYLDNQDGQYMFCLAVTLEDKSFVDYHMAFTAATGQVADSHDIKEITTRYLAEEDEDIDDSEMGHFGTSGGGPGWIRSFETTMTMVIALASITFSAYEVYTIHSGNMPRQVAASLNTVQPIHWGLHALLTLTMLFRCRWWRLVLNAPLLLYRAFVVSGNQHHHSEASITGRGMKEHGSGALSTPVRLYITTLYNTVLLIYYFVGLF